MIDLNTWNLSIPVGQPAVTINTPLLANGYQDDYFKAANGAIFFWAPVNGSTTKSAKYPRSELRETFADGKLRNWKYSAADNYLNATLKVTQVPTVGKIVIGQVHNSDGDNPPLKLSYQYKNGTGSIVAIIRLKPTDVTSSVSILKNVALNQVFSYGIRVSKTGAMSVTVQPAGKAATVWNAQLDSAWAASPLYFKAGSYVQDNEGDNTEAGAVTFTALQIKHL